MWRTALLKGGGIFNSLVYMVPLTRNPNVAGTQPGVCAGGVYFTLKGQSFKRQHMSIRKEMFFCNHVWSMLRAIGQISHLS